MSLSDFHQRRMRDVADRIVRLQELLRATEAQGDVGLTHIERDRMRFDAARISQDLAGAEADYSALATDVTKQLEEAEITEAETYELAEALELSVNRIDSSPQAGSASGQLGTVKQFLRSPVGERKHLVKVVIPIIPFLAQFETHYALAADSPLAKAYEKLVSRLGLGPHESL